MIIALIDRIGVAGAASLDAIHMKFDELNDGILPPRVKVIPMLDRSDLLRFTLPQPDRVDYPDQRHPVSGEVMAAS